MEVSWGLDVGLLSQPVMMGLIVEHNLISGRWIWRAREPESLGQDEKMEGAGTSMTERLIRDDHLYIDRNREN